MKNQNDVLVSLEKFRSKLTAAQRAFLDIRRNTDTDAAAYSQINLSRQSVSRWKKEDNNFLQAYTIITQVLEDPRQALALPESDRRVLVAQQLDALTEVLPLIVQEHINMAMHAPKEADRLRAMSMLYEVLGFQKDAAMPISKQNKVLQGLLNAMQPQVASEAEKRGVPGAQLTDLVYTEEDDSDYAEEGDEE